MVQSLQWLLIKNLYNVELYNSQSSELRLRTAKHKSKLKEFDFNVVYKSGNTTPPDFKSGHPTPPYLHTARECIELGMQEEMEDAQKIVNRVDERIFAVTILVLGPHMSQDEMCVSILRISNEAKEWVEVVSI